MKTIKITFISLEITAIIAVVVLAFSDVSAEAEFYKAMYISLLSILAVAMQKEQQEISLDNDTSEG